MALSDIYKNSSEKHPEQDTDAHSLSTGSEQNVGVVQVDKNVKEIGVISAAFLMLNRMLGAGVFSTGSTIFALSGSVGTSLMMWFAGTIIALSGLLVYMELGSAIPRNGGEKNYLEYMFKKPKFLVTAMYASYVFFLGWAAGNSIVVGEYILNAAGKEVTQWNSRGIGIAVITFAFLINAIHIKTGLFLANALGVFKVFIVLFITVTGWVALGGGIKSNNFQPTHNFTDAFKGTTPTAFGIVNALYNVIWSYVGYSNANYALGEIKNPHKVLRLAAPIAFVSLGIIYMFVNIAYFAVVPKEEIASSERILAAAFFRYAFGNKAEKAASVFVALSAWANVMSVIFSQGRIVQQLGREGSLPFSRFFATSRPFGTPFVGLMQHWIVCIVTIVAPPPGDAYNFILNLISYPLNVVNTVVAAGLLYIYYKKSRGLTEWNPPIKASLPVVFFFFLASLYLIVAPYIPPVDGQTVYNSLPYWIHAVVTWGVFGIGLVYWLVWVKILPYFGSYKLVAVEVLGDDGFWRNKIYKVSKDSVESEIHDAELDKAEVI
ncbi:high-affinity methionine permease [Spathaspora passalidarum NRRL Y-27907]|uniref:High-affinity methionine permease n=1 Tax=Spathaspora passalidarum (strain NRRL Y-27907 / 11-Y1) TaxID=619300 RepID=G3AN08_SPAPN|nr:high-affinity methionine permease [Spathaspora passalidarum NRRL Y-27907]EGW32422.1 high-affinity methionine permease [Spathaspora passalidarum NRRL Y-27907]